MKLLIENFKKFLLERVVRSMHYITNPNPDTGDAEWTAPKELTVAEIANELNLRPDAKHFVAESGGDWSDPKENAAINYLMTATPEDAAKYIEKLNLGAERKYVFMNYSDYGRGARSKEEFEQDRAAKKKWNLFADHDFFNNKVTKIHWVGGFAEKAQCEGITFCVLPKLKFLKFGRHKDEISTIGYYQSEPILKTLSDIGFIVDGYVTIAADQDAGTEWTSKATPEDIERHKGSGLPKRPSISMSKFSPFETPIAEDAFMYGEEDFVEPPDSETGYNELIVDNWTIGGIVVHLAGEYWQSQATYNSGVPGMAAIPKHARTEELKSILFFAKKKGIEVFDTQLNPITDAEVALAPTAPTPPPRQHESNTTPTSDEMNEIREGMSKFMKAWLKG